MSLTIGFAVGSRSLVPTLACGSSGIESSALNESFVVVPAFHSGWFVVCCSQFENGAGFPSGSSFFFSTTCS